MRPAHPTFEQIPLLRQLWQQAFGDTDAFLDGFFATAFAPDRCLCIGDGAQMLSAAYWLPVELEAGKGAYIYAVATAENHRGKGLAHALMAAIHQQLREQGYVAAVLVPAKPGLEQFYGAMGYRLFGGIHTFCALAKSPVVALQEIGGAEYAARRKAYLPAGAVVQEGDSMAFLESYARLYTGEDFVLAAYREENTLVGLELLGNAEKAPHILQALGATQGTFRIPGDAPFTMWLPFQKCQEPTYFGIAFD